MKIYDLLIKYNLKNVTITGNNLTASCPYEKFHESGKDEHPSWGINLENGLWNCFACGRRGNLFHLIAFLEDRSVEEIKSEFYREKNYLLELKQRRNLLYRKEEEKLLLVDLPKCCKPIDELIWSDTNSSKYKFVEYLKGRGLDYQTIERFEVNYSLVGSLTNRVIMPVRHHEGFMLSWQARSIAIKNYKFPIGSQHKKTLFNLYRYWNEPVEKLFVVEGTFDCMKLEACGEKAVAIFGAHISKRQAKLLSRTALSVVLFFDPDMPGRVALKEAIQFLKNRSVEILKVDSPSSDPSDLSLKQIQNLKIVPIK